MIRSTASHEDPVAWLLAGLYKYPSRPCITNATGRVWTYQEVFERSGRVATALTRLGVKMGDRVTVQVEKSPEAFILYLGCLRLGAVFMPLNTAYTAHELEYFIGDAEPKVIVIRPSDLSSVRVLPCLQKKVGRFVSIVTFGKDGEGSFSELLYTCSSDEFKDAGLESDSLAALLYTSGTTGRSKGAMLTRRNLAENAVRLIEAWKITSDDILLHALPIFHAHGLFIGGNTLLAAGAQMRFLSRFDADEVINHLPNSTMMMGVPTFYARLLEHPRLSIASTKHIRLFISGSAPLLKETFHEFRKRTGHAILERYAMTETLVITTNPCNGPRAGGSVGLPLDGVELRIAGPTSGGESSASLAVGGIEVRSPSLFKGYWRNPGKTAEDMREDGFFITGDIGKVDENGYLYIVGRAKDLIISGGYNVYPREVEDELDKIEGVEESAVIGVRHKDFGEAVTAVLRLKPGFKLIESNIIQLLNQRLARYKCPKRIIFVDRLPRNALGKVQKDLLRREYASLYI